MRHHSTTRTRIAGTIAVATAGALALAGCSVTGATSSGSAGDGTGTVNVLLMKQASYSEQDQQAIAKAFEKANPDIDVKITSVAYEALHDKIVTAAPAGTYDVVLVDVIWPAEFADKGIIADISDRIPSSWSSDMLGGALETAKYKDKYWGVPWVVSSKLFYYNAAQVKAVGATADELASWDGVLDVAKRIKSQLGVQYPLAWSWSQSEALICDYAQLLGAFGGQFVDQDGKLIINDKAGVDALTWMKKSIDEGLTNPGSTTFLEDDVLKTMSAGQASFTLNWESSLRDLNDTSKSSIAGDAAVLQTPAGPDGDRPSVNGNMALSITKNSKNQDAAWKFIEFASSQKIQDAYVKSSMPDWKSSYQNPEIVKTNPDVLAAAAKAFDDGILRPTVPAYNKVSQVIQVELQNALLGSKTPKQALDDAVAEGNKMLEKN
jgi:multiple sugar transport system substrate-binding protein